MTLHPSSCPWDFLTRVPPEFCEESLCGWVRQPANTWSNIGFLLVAMLILREAKRDGAGHLKGLALVAFVTAIGSAFYHASETFVGRIADYLGMFLGASYMLAVNVRRLTLWRPPLIRALFWVSCLGLLGTMILQPKLATTLYITETVVCCVGLEVILFIRQGHTIRYRWLLWYWGIFFVAYGVWLLDIHHILCVPGNHLLTGHGIWHLLDSYALLVLYRYYTQFRELEPLHIP